MVIFLRSVPQGNRNINKNKWNLIKLTIFCTEKETISKMKRQLGKNICNDVADKGFIYTTGAASTKTSCSTSSSMVMVPARSTRLLALGG